MEIYYQFFVQLTYTAAMHVGYRFYSRLSTHGNAPFHDARFCSRTLQFCMTNKRVFCWIFQARQPMYISECLIKRIRLEWEFYVLLTVHPGIILKINPTRCTIFLIMFLFSVCFGRLCAHHQEK